MYLCWPKMKIPRRPFLGPRSRLSARVWDRVRHSRTTCGPICRFGQCGIRLPLLIRNRIQGVKSGFMDTEGLKLIRTGYSCYAPVLNLFFRYFWISHLVFLHYPRDQPDRLEHNGEAFCRPYRRQGRLRSGNRPRTGCHLHFALWRPK